ncbi:MFS transporter [Myceligenerans salitolerans]|uniref:MFS transporter n=1 Tax=Myceligenerans salitolerans TaxID=1230528 RepID=A0ABS3I468_9MICO|nr:MFS transporter [Myceligenerans salitolerans]MBO0607806.1 MFS transporter [Myceligenerans salitolerans]
MSEPAPVVQRADGPPGGHAAHEPSQYLRTPTFRWLTAGWALTNFADSALMLIVAIWVADLTGNAAAGGLTFAMLGLPALASPFLGVLADRVSRRKLLACAYLLGAACLVPLFWVHDAGTAWVIYPVTVLYALVAYVTAAGQSGLLKDLLPDEALGHANARLAMIDQVFRVAMPFAGAGAYAFAGPFVLVAATIAAFVGAAVVFACLRFGESVVPPEQRVTVREVAGGFRQLYAGAPLRPLTNVMLVAFAFIGLVNAVVFAVLEDVGIPNAWLPPLLVLQGVGGLAAGALTPRLMLRWGRGRVVAVGILLAGAGLAPLLLAMVPLVVVAQLALGFGTTSAVVAYVTERQVVTPSGLQGRTAAASQLLLNFPQVVFTVAGAALLAVWDWRVIVAVNVAALLLAGLAGLRVRPPAPRPPAPRPSLPAHHDQAPPGPAPR